MIFPKNHLTTTHLYDNICLVLETSNNKCDSGVVGNARPCQGRDRGFEPRLSLLMPEDFSSGFFV